MRRVRSPLGLMTALILASTPLIIPVTARCAPKPSYPPTRPRSQAEVMRRMSNEPGILINIHRGLFPATGDITLLGQQITPALRKGLLGNTDASVRWRVAQVLTQLRDPSARPELHAALKDWNATVRHQVLIALASVGSRQSVPLILSRLSDPDEPLSNRVAALRALGRIGDGRAARAIAAQYIAGKEQPSVRRAAVAALWDLRRSAPRALLTQLLHAALTDKDELVVRRAAIAVGVLRDRSALPLLHRVLIGKSSMLRNVAAYVMGRVGDPKAVPILMSALPRVRSGRLLNNISFALKRLGSPRLWPHLQRLLINRQAFIRLNAAYTAGEMRLGQAREGLEGLLSDPNQLVRAEAVVALAKLRDPRAISALMAYAEKSGSAQRTLTLRAVVFIQSSQPHRNRYLKAALKLGRRREAALVLAALGDSRAAPMLFPVLTYSSERTIWRAARKLGDPLLNTMVGRQLRGAVQRGSVGRLNYLLDHAGPSVATALSLPLLQLLYKHWNGLTTSRPSYLPSLLAVIRSLGHSGSIKLKRWLAPYAEHANFRVRQEARLALARLGDKAALAELVNELARAADHHRLYLAGLLGRLPLAQLKIALAPLLKRRDPYLLIAAGAALFYAGDSTNAQVRQGLRATQSTLRTSARHYLAVGMSAARHQVLKTLRTQERDPVAQAELDRLLRSYQPQQAAFRGFFAREVVLN